MNYDRVLAVDPGKTTGIVIFDAAEHRETGAISTMHYQLDFKPTMDFCYEYAEWCNVMDVRLLIACEAFIIGPQTLKKSRQMWSLYLIGALHLIAHRMNFDLVMQKPAEAKQFCADGRLKSLGMYFPGQDHANDAARHAVLALVNKQWYDERLKY